MELIAVVMHCKSSVDRFESAKALLNYGFSNYALVTPEPEDGIPPVPVVLGTQEFVTPVPQSNAPLLLERRAQRRSGRPWRRTRRSARRSRPGSSSAA